MKRCLCKEDNEQEPITRRGKKSGKKNEDRKDEKER